MTPTTHWPVRYTVCTYNIWTTTRWPERRTALQKFVQHQMPDILCLQELQADSKLALDEVLLPTHQRVEDAFEGWTQEGNLYWHKDLFELVEYGAENIEILEPLRRMFWARLRLNDGTNRTLFVSTAHFTYNGHPEAVASEKYIQIGQARATVEALKRLSCADEPQLFMGDLNDSDLAVRLLKKSGGLVDCFEALGQRPHETYPAYPTASSPSETLDWMLHRGAIYPMTATIIDYFHDELSPSDHKPIIVTYQM